MASWWKTESITIFLCTLIVVSLKFLLQQGHLYLLGMTLFWQISILVQYKIMTGFLEATENYAEFSDDIK
jgi:hypothetical protein